VLRYVKGRLDQGGSVLGGYVVLDFVLVLPLDSLYGNDFEFN
jgi:hypothetical protein